MAHDPGAESARTARISARGRLGLRNAQLLVATVGQLRRSGDPCVLVDLSSVTGAEPAALALLARLHREVGASGGRLLLGELPAAVGAAAGTAASGTEG